MTYFCRVGLNSANASGIEARGYRIFRQGTTVRAVWGPISIERRQHLSIVWARKTLYKEYENRTVKEAQVTLRGLLDARLREGYFVLPSGSCILPLKFAAGVTARL